MDDTAKKHFGSACLNTVETGKLPSWLVEVFDLYERRYFELLSNKTSARHERPLVMLIAELIHKSNEKIAALETRLASLESASEKPKAVLKLKEAV